MRIIKKKFKIRYLYITVFVAGAAVLTLELLGSRIMAPFFGNTLYVWSSLISVAIASLAAGYYFGGWLADKRPDFNLLYLIILFVGMTIIIIPRIDAVILTSTITLGIKFGPFLAAFILFSAPIVLLGMVAPFAIKLAAEKLETIGKRAGSLYATETLGGFFGSIITGFFLIPSIGITLITILLASILFLLSGIWFVLAGKAKMLFIIVPVLPVLLLPSSVNKDNAAVVYRTQSLLGEIKVVDRGPQRVLLIEGATQAWAEHGGGEFRTSSSFARKVPFMYFMNPEMKDVLVLGLGSGLLSGMLEKEFGLSVDTVDINGEILYVAREFFGFTGTAFIEDARTYVRSTPKKYDGIVFDMAHGDGYPPHMFSQESFREIKNILTPEGILVINFNGPAHSIKVTSVFKTLKTIFDNVLILSNPDFEEILSTKFFFVTDSVIDKEEVKNNVYKYVESLGHQETLVNVWENYMIEFLEGGVLITDDYNPLDNFQIEMTIAWRERNWRDFGALLLR